MDTFQTIGQLIVDKSIDLSIMVSKESDERCLAYLNENGLVDDTVIKWRAQFITNIGKAILAQDETEVLENVLDWATETGKGAVNFGIAIDELMMCIKFYRKVIWDYVEKELEIDNMKPLTILKVNRIIGALLDHTAYTFSVSYVNHQRQTLEAKQKAFDEISFPVVALSEKMAILPLIGELDEERVSVLLENVLQKCTALRTEELIIDLSGVPSMHTTAINQLFQLNDSLNLIGVSPVFTGIRPSLAIPMMELGVCFEKLTIRGTLKEALSTHPIF